MLAEAGRDDWLLCQITSQPFTDACAVTLLDGDFVDAGSRLTGHARPAKLFTANASLVCSVAGQRSELARERAGDALVKLLRRGKGGDDQTSTAT